MKEIDQDEYEDEIWLAYVEPQYENEYSKMLAAQRTPLVRKAFDEEQNAEKRKQVQSLLARLNQNVEVPVPKTLTILKAAL